MDAFGLLDFAQRNNYTVKMLNTEGMFRFGPKAVNAVGNAAYPYGKRTSHHSPFHIIYGHSSLSLVAKKYSL